LFSSCQASFYIVRICMKQFIRFSSSSSLEQIEGIPKMKFCFLFYHKKGGFDFEGVYLFEIFIWLHTTQVSLINEKVWIVQGFLILIGWVYIIIRQILDKNSIKIDESGWKLDDNQTISNSIKTKLHWYHINYNTLQYQHP